MNKLVYYGLKITTDNKFIQFKLSDSNSLISDTSLSLLTINFIENSVSQDFDSLDDSIEVVLQDIPIEELSATKITNTEFRFNNLVITKLNLSNHYFSQIKQKVINSRVVNDGNFTFLYVSDSITLEEYRTLLESIYFIEIKEFSDESNYNFYKILLSDKDRNIESINTKVYSNKSVFNRYLFDEAIVVKGLLDNIIIQLEKYQVEISKVDDITKHFSSKNAFYYKINNSAQIVKRRFASGIMSKVELIELPMEFRVNLTAISSILDFRNRYNNLELLSNLTSIEISDYRNNTHRISVEWELLSGGNIGDKEAITDSNSNYSFQINFNCKILYNMILDDSDFNIINNIRLLMRNIEVGNTENTIDIILEKSNE